VTRAFMIDALITVSASGRGIEVKKTLQVKQSAV
jgi:hypothetical protein